MAEGRGRLSSIDLLPQEATEDVVWAFQELNARKRPIAEIHAEFNERLEAKDIEPISRSAFYRASVETAAKAKRLEERNAIIKGLSGMMSAETMDEANIVTGELLKALVEDILNAGADKLTPKNAQELANAYLSAIKAQRQSMEHRLRKEEAFKAGAEKVIEAAAREAGLSKEQVAQIRRDVLGVKGGS